MTNPPTPIVSTSEPPAIILPAPDVFFRRAARFDQLAAGHALGDWLRYLGALSRAQQSALQNLSDLPLPDATVLERARAHRMPPLPAQSWPRPAAWKSVLRQIAAAMQSVAPEQARSDLARCATLPDTELESLAERVLHTEFYGDDASLLPYVGAALQVVWTRLASTLGAGITALDVPGVCPCCGFLPVASIVKPAGEVANLRYLHCALCNTEWNLVRVKCAACDSTAGIGYHELQGDAVKQPGAVRAEICDSCKSYLKIVYQDKGGGDPVADDLATLALDILVDEAGYSRAGPNLLLIPGG